MTKKSSKEKILQAASDLFLHGGIQALSVRAIAKSAELSTIGIYSHFQGKQGILDSLYTEGFNMVDAAMDVLSLDLTPKEAVITALENYLHFGEHYEAHYKLIFGENQDGYEPGKDAMEAGAKAFVHLTKVVSRLLPQAKTLQDKQQNAVQFWALAHGYVSLKHHKVSGMMDTSHWKEQALTAVALHVDAVIAQQS